ncbi:MAG: glycosyltransferase family 2 protein [Chloroflexi bacterium]|nr:glycosyltransferase family 2 protein [Chloroflexota bacterium]MBV9134280.1 glycosyltransferase family 2 protein [Chloroflexota bacterium]MBV9894529.1 glycosyltransferase family 2 protein [Chloroflexota bacterium]
MKTPKVPQVSVIVLTYNARPFVERCLTAVLGQSFADFELIMVDNDSHDGTADFVRQRYPTVRVIDSHVNEGYGAGNNLGVAHARGDTLVFLNPDAIPEPDWLANLVGAMHTQQSRFATSKIVLESDNERLNSGGNLIHYLGLSFCRGVKAHRSAFDRQELVSGASGAACAITRELFERIGGFDPTFFLYHDDVDLSLRALLAGEPCLYVPSAVVSHDYELSVPPMKWGWIEAHRYAILLKTFSVPTVLLLLPALIAIDLVTFAYLAVRGPAYVAAKLRSYGWVLRQATAIQASRRRAQAVRALPDRELLAKLGDRIPYEQLSPLWLAQLANLLIDPWFRLYRRLTLAIIHW